MTSTRLIVKTLARAFIAGDFTEEALLERGSLVCGDKKPFWLKAVVKALLKSYSETSRPRFKEIEEHIRILPPFEKALSLGRIKVNASAVEFLSPPQMRPVAGSPESWKLPQATDFRALAEVLELHPDDLGWFTDPRCRTEHYHYRWHEKGKGRGRRLIEIPKPLLKQTQRTLLAKVVEKIPPHESSCGFQKERSIFDFVAPHCQKRFVLKVDLEDFFPSITPARVVRLFMTAGYPEYVAVVLATLASNAVPSEVLDESGLSIQAQAKLLRHHLPQGAPSSPALANLCAFRLDCRLSGLARAAGAVYTRYADDLLFSGGDDFRRGARKFYIAALAVIIDEGFKANLRKTRFMQASQRQHAAGLILNEKPNVKREEYDQLKAILHNCVREGWQSQNLNKHPEFRSHLEGRLGWVSASNSARGEKLRAVFEKIVWD